MSSKIANQLQTFYSSVRKTPYCWNWTGAVDDDGYAWTDVPRRPRRAVAFLYETMYRPLAKTKRLGLSCFNRRCVNPNHIEILGGYIDHLKLLKEQPPVPIRRGKYDDPVAYFWIRVNKDGPIPSHKPELGSCWLWAGAPSGTGYAGTHIGGKNMLVHRYSYILDGNDIPEDLELDHLCRNKLCVNPKHLEAVTHEENMKRTVLYRNEHNKGYNLPHCKNGHLYTPQTEVYRLDKKYNKMRRICRVCINQRRKKDFSGYSDIIIQAE